MQGHRVSRRWADRWPWSLSCWFLALISGPLLAGSAFSVEHRETSFDIYRLEKGEEQALHLFWKRPDGTPYISLYALRQDLAERGEQLVFAINGGIYSRAMAPLGLYIENGQTFVPLNRGAGGGNFFLKPNGIFYVTPQGAQVVETDGYHPQDQVLMAIQSGPMLVTKGVLHPRFIPEYESRYVRNGVGVDTSGRVVFAISEGAVNFHDFGTLFRDLLDCPNALYLDGQISQMYLPELHHYALWAWRPLVSIIGLTRTGGE